MDAQMLSTSNKNEDDHVTHSAAITHEHLKFCTTFRPTESYGNELYWFALLDKGTQFAERSAVRCPAGRLSHGRNGYRFLSGTSPLIQGNTIRLHCINVIISL